MKRRNRPKQRRKRRTTKNHRLNIIVLPKHPYEQLGEVVGVYELAQGLACSGDDEGCVVFCVTRMLEGLFGRVVRGGLTFCEVAFVDEAWYDMGVF